ncbi:conserved hypothetical protein [Histoplasma capsulatum var. duboisii H88]|uniref:Uncharacterized protein n=2 Tax=Ajellomyces capsulatus TaxID=5037 RepID=F0UE89_AJEC8|nr:conserved hypothetical protein [Histoplasma capsulatum H143]EGC44619.1 conserved hypothetical protein [Histoplasma capsulatum var. duboisii H88]QSS55392.1 hypothetical protein I7I53_03255 [Histoplasma capsulatum var. duboisii H88]
MVSYFSCSGDSPSIFQLPKPPPPDNERNAATAEEHPPVNKSPNCADFTIAVQYQMGLDIIGVVAAGRVYNVDDHIVLKACRIYEPPSSDAIPRILWDYASETIFHSGFLNDERAPACSTSSSKYHRGY